MVRRSRTENPPRGDLALSGVPFGQVPTSIFLLWSLTAGSPSKTMCAVLSLVSLKLRIGILRLVKRVFVVTSVLLRCYYAFVLPILEYCSPLWGSAAAECHFQTFLSLCHQRHVAALCMLYKVNSKSNHFLFSELPSASGRVRHTRATRTYV